jgi:hypothetical protein
MLQQMGLGAQGAQLAAMALEEQQKSKAMTEEAALRGQQSESNTLAIERAKQVNAETTQASTDRSAFRTQAAQAINASETLTASEKQALSAQVAAGGFDGNGAALYEIVSPKPIKIGDQLVQKGANGQWTTVTDTTGPSRRTTLQASANIQYANNLPALAMITEGINSGAITDAKEFDALAPIPKPGVALQPSPNVELYAQAGVERASAAASQLNKIDSILTTIYAEGGLMSAPAGVFSAVAEAAKDTLGLRDTISQVRTAFTGQRNLDLINAMPKGAASDRDVMIFAKGYPPDNATVAEMAEYLEAAKSTMYKIQDFETIASQILSAQYNSGVPPTTIGLQAQAEPIMASIKSLNERASELETAVNSGDLTAEAATQLLNADIGQFQTTYKFIPSKYSR